MSPKRKPSEEKTEEMPIINRASQWSVDVVFIVKNLGLPTTLGIALVVGAWYGVPWYGENVLKPESVARIESSKSTAAALVTFADAHKIAAENQKLSLTIENKRQENDEKFTTHLRVISEVLSTIDVRLSKIEGHQ